jgi:hypothetical protein
MTDYDDDYDPMIKWVIDEVIQAITKTEPNVYTDEQWLSLYDTINNELDCAEEHYREYQAELRADAEPNDEH